ncbi:hypothetical protein ACPW7J_11040 [Ihubacter sp. rT4E-8]|uniref:hypothetical protein n=1 Tax=unclassified Ihubacter TaxID=2633299 RepID=UPI003C7EA1C2
MEGGKIGRSTIKSGTLSRLSAGIYAIESSVITVEGGTVKGGLVEDDIVENAKIGKSTGFSSGIYATGNVSANITGGTVGAAENVLYGLYAL